MGILSARKSVFIKAGLRDRSQNHDLHFSARKSVFIKAGLRDWSQNHDLPQFLLSIREIF